MKLDFHFLWFYACLISLLSFSVQEMPGRLMAPLNESIIEDSNSPKKKHQEKEFRKEEEENQQEENEEEDCSEDIEVEEKSSDCAQGISTRVCYGKKACFQKKKLLSNIFYTVYNDTLQNHLPFYILFSCLKIDC